MRKAKEGQTITEFAIIFPVLILLTLGIIQMTLIYVARGVVHYAAFCAARAELVNENGERAAEIACTPITGTTLPILPFGLSIPTDISIPGWDLFVKSGISILKTDMSASERSDDEITVRVVHYYELIIPLVNRVFAYPWEEFLGLEPVAPFFRIDQIATGEFASGIEDKEELIYLYLKHIDGVPHIEIAQSCTLPTESK